MFIYITKQFRQLSYKEAIFFFEQMSIYTNIDAVSKLQSSVMYCPQSFSLQNLNCQAGMWIKEYFKQDIVVFTNSIGHPYFISKLLIYLIQIFVKNSVLTENYQNHMLVYIIYHFFS